MKPRLHPCPIYRHFVVAHVGLPQDLQLRLQSEVTRKRFGDLVGQGTQRCVLRRNVERAAHSGGRLDGTDVCGHRILDGQDRPPDSWVADNDATVLQGGLEHRVDDQVQPHPRAVAADGALAQDDDAEVAVLQVADASLGLQLADAVGMGSSGRRVLVPHIVLGEAVDRAGRREDEPADPGTLGEVGQVGWCRGVVHVIERRAELRHRIIRQACQEDDHVGPGQIRLGQRHHVFADNGDLSGQMVAEPAQVSSRHGVPAGGQAGAQHRSDVASTAGDQDSHGSNRLLHQSSTGRKTGIAGRAIAATVICGGSHRACRGHTDDSVLR